MKCVIPGANVKIIARAIHALAKIGDEMYVQPQANSFSLRAINLANSAYADFTFFEGYFAYYASGDLEEDDMLKCKISMRSAMTVFKAPSIIDKQVETCHIELKPNADVLFITLNYKNTIVKQHILPIIDCEKLEAAYMKDDAANQLSCKASVLGDAIHNFQQNLIEITLEILPQKVLLRNYLDDTSNVAKVTRTQLALCRAEFDRYSVSAETTITFCMKELKAILNFAELVRIPLDIYFESAGRPVVFALKDPSYEAHLLLSTLNPDADSQSQVTVDNKVTKPAQKRKTVKRSKKLANSTSKTNITSSPHKKINDNAKRTPLKEDPRREDAASIDTAVASSDLFSDARTTLSVKSVTHNVLSNILKRKSRDGCINALRETAAANGNELENAIPKSPSPPSKKARVIFKKCFQTTFHPQMLPGHDSILAEDSDDDNN